MTPVVQGDFQPTPSNHGSAELRSATSVLLERMQFLRAAGLSFNGLRDMYDILGYDRLIRPEQYRARYTRGGIAGRVVDAMPKATWRGGGELIEDEDPKVSTPFEEAWLELDERLKLWPTFQKVDILAGQGRYAVLLLGAPGDFDQELKKGAPEKLVYVTPFSEEDAKILSWETDEHSPRFGLPTSYQLNRMSANSLSIYGSSGVPAFMAPALQKPVHWSRIIHVAENTLDNEVFGQPGLERVWNLLDDLDKVTGGGAEAFWLRANQGLNLNVDKTITPTPEELESLRQQADEYQHQIRRMLRTRGVDVKELGSDVANFSNPADAVLTQIAGAKAIPKRILTGSEMGELASSQDRENFKDQVNGRQTGHAAPNIVRPFADRCILYAFLPTPKDGPTKYQVFWPHMQILTEQEKSTGAKDWVSCNNTQGSPVFLVDEVRDKWYGLPPLTPEDIQKEKERNQPIQPPAATGVTMGPDGVPVGPDGQPLPKGPDGKHIGPDGQPVEIGPDGQLVPPPPKPPLPFQKKPDPNAEDPNAPAAKIKAAEAAELLGVLTVLESAIRSGNTDTIDQILGIQHRDESTIVMPDVTITPPPPPPPAPATTVRKEYQYGEVQGVMRPVAIIERTVTE